MERQESEEKAKVAPIWFLYVIESVQVVAAPAQAPPQAAAPPTAASQAQRKEVQRRMVEERRFLLESGLYTTDDRVIRDLDAKIRQLEVE